MKKKKSQRKNLQNFWKLGKDIFGTHHYDVSSDGELVVREGNYQYNLEEFVKRFGTPLEVVFPFVIENRLIRIIELFTSYIHLNKYKGKFFFHYPMKVNQNKEFVLPVLSEGGHLETSSANELWLVKRMWENEHFSTKIKVLCNGPKTNRYLSLIEELKLKNLDIIPIIENQWEFQYLRGYRGDVGIRVAPDVKVKSYWDKQTDQFGFSISELKDIGRVRNLKMLSYHAGSQIMRGNDLILPARKVMELFIKMKKYNPQLSALNLGGGFAVPYEKKIQIYTLENVIRRLVRMFGSMANRAGISHPDIAVEWGRYVVAPAQITIYKIIAQKPIARTTSAKGAATMWYYIDGSFITDLLDTWAIHQKWHVIPINHMETQKFSRVWLSGSSCDSDDKYSNGGSYILLPRIDDVENGGNFFIGVLDTGAYQDSLATDHCLLSSPTKIIAQNGVVTVARKRETPEEIGKRFGW